MAVEKLEREEAILVLPCKLIDNFIVRGYVDIEHGRHVLGGLLCILRDEGSVTCCFWHLHAPVVSESSRNGAKHEDYPPGIVNL
ncbi:Os04g0187001 [Oryza sativa Japonica Group]|uniref:Os04g0187001 protein n=1 Tax=Oryza sativa subsp. japonica TaxID=39947 RepID=A0A0N7KIM1_ORYSJ|nr:hypothetical protein EE612_022362 [Oryza sativa]BAS88001.1 Os04g0187001 [Oryza sativa Japonica Group]